MWMWIVICALMISLIKWIIYKISFMAVLLYYGEKGIEMPAVGVIQEYQLKVVKRLLGIKRI